MGLRFRMHVYMIILIWCFLFAVVVAKMGFTGTLPSYEVLSQRNVTKVHMMRLFVFIHVIKNE